MHDVIVSIANLHSKNPFSTSNQLGISINLGKVRRSKNLKRKYGKKLAYEYRDEAGSIEVLEDRNQRSLHFGGKEQQSAMNLRDPQALVLSYTRVMMMALFLRTPQKVLMLGLGGGSIPKFIHHHHPQCMIDVVENREPIVPIAYDLFLLPRSPKIEVFVADAKDYLKHRKQQYDLIFVDLFDRDGFAASATGYPFIHTCRQHLQAGGMLVFNLWSHPEELYQKMRSLIFRSFNNQVLELPTATGANQILFAHQSPIESYCISSLSRRVKQQEGQLKLGAPQLLNELYQQNKHFFTHH